jgi:hypothetical protein
VPSTTWRGTANSRPNTCVGGGPTHWGYFERRSIQVRRHFVGRAPLDAAMAWAQRRIQEHGRRAKPDPRWVLSALRPPIAKGFVGRAPLDAAPAWAQRRIQERASRAVLDPRWLFPAPLSQVATSFVGRAAARRGAGGGRPVRCPTTNRLPPPGGLAVATRTPAAARNPRGPSPGSSPPRCN